MSRAVIYVFSGTENTLLAARLLSCALTVRGVETDVFRVGEKHASVPDPREYDLAGFGYPIHAFNTPRFFLRFVEALPSVGKGKRAFIFKTSGEPFHANTASSLPLVRLLKKKGFQPGMDRHLLMPYNIMFRYPDALAKQMYLHTRGMAELMAKEITENKWNRPTYQPVTVLFMLLMRIQWLGARLNGPLIHADPTRCTRCGLCVKNCPAGNISMGQNGPVFSDRCTMCMGCVFHCPRDAVRPGFLNPWRVNGAYPFERLAEDKRVPGIMVDKNTKGYFKTFRRYYERTRREMEAEGIRPSGL